MKHPLTVTLILVILFVLTQLVGLGFLAADMEITEQDGEITITHPDTAIGERPALSGLGTFLYIAIGVGVGTALILLLIRFRARKIWRLWFWLAVFLTISVALGVIFESWIALLVAAILATWKVFKPNPITHNLSEVLMYTGLAVLLVPILNLLWMSILLIAISIYDMIAVWQSKHMVKMATFQAESKLFAGLLVPKDKEAWHQGMNAPKPGKATKGRATHAILGGGDLAFPLLFAGVVLQWLVRNGQPLMTAYLISLIIVVTSTISLFLLFYGAKKDRFYPAMPFLSAGCFVGLGLVLLL